MIPCLYFLYLLVQWQLPPQPIKRSPHGSTHSLWMMSGPIVDSMILSMAEPRSEEVDAVDAVESDTTVAPSVMTLEWTRTCGDSDTMMDWLIVETLETKVDWAIEDESGR